MRRNCVLGCLLVAGLGTAMSCVAEIPSERMAACREYVSEKWDKLRKIMGKAVDLRDELPNLPRSAWFSRDQVSQQEDIDDLLDDAREILLSKSSRDMLVQIQKLDGKINGIKSEIAEVNKDLILHPDRRQKCEERINELIFRRNELRRNLLSLKREVMAELRSWGITVSDAALEPFFKSVTRNSIIDNAVIAGNIAAVVKNLEAMMQVDEDNARRYYGMYMVLLDVQIRCYRGFIVQCDGVWCVRLDNAINKIQYDHLIANEGAADPRFSAAQRDQYKRNRRTNETYLRAVRAYRENLERQRNAVAAKMQETERMREVALNTYETLGNAALLRDMMHTSAEAFEAVMKLDLPDLAAFNDADIVSEFEGITRRLLAEDPK